jgi:hypothetical protein
LRGIRGKQGGVLAKCHLLPPPRIRTEREGWCGHGRPAGAPAGGPVHGRGWGVGKSERGTRGSHHRAHLGLGRAVEAAPRKGSGAAAVLGGDGAVGLGEEGRSCCETAVVRCGDLGSRRPPFIGGGGRFGKGRFFSRRAQLRRARAASRRRPVTRQLVSGGRSTRAGEG